ncbi:hypothetical protein ACET97_21555, partial [Aeromonas enteropelogenes]|uniref:hypothetical protein n=1 Tax=Aeromonas enteropelogenes TaxID=29489 RepID=UPI0038D1DF33
MWLCALGGIVAGLPLTSPQAGQRVAVAGAPLTCDQGWVCAAGGMVVGLPVTSAQEGQRVAVSGT